MPSVPPVNKPSQRLFLALWPDAACQAQLAAHLRLWHLPPDSAPYQPDDWHVTLHFIGQVDAGKLPDITTGVAVPFQPFEMLLDQPRLWPHGLAVLCASQVPKQLWSLFDRLGQALRGLGLPVDTRPYRPHLTLARHADGAVAPPISTPVVVQASSYALVISAANQSRRYRVLHRYES